MAGLSTVRISKKDRDTGFESHCSVSWKLSGLSPCAPFSPLTIFANYIPQIVSLYIIVNGPHCKYPVVVVLHERYISKSSLYCLPGHAQSGTTSPSSLLSTPSILRPLDRVVLVHTIRPNKTVPSKSTDTSKYLAALSSRHNFSASDPAPVSVPSLFALAHALDSTVTNPVPGFTSSSAARAFSAKVYASTISGRAKMKLATKTRVLVYALTVLVCASTSQHIVVFRAI